MSNPSPSLHLCELEKHFDSSQFNCGRPSLNEWLQKYAWQNHRAENSKVYVVVKANIIVGYHALCAGQIKHTEATKRIVKGQPRHPIPIIKIARLAVDTSMQGKGLGGALLKDALQRCLSAADTIGARAIVIDALDKSVISFYGKYGFESGPDNDLSMMLLMKDLRASFDAAK